MIQAAKNHEFDALVAQAPTVAPGMHVVYPRDTLEKQQRKIQTIMGSTPPPQVTLHDYRTTPYQIDCYLATMPWGLLHDLVLMRVETTKRHGSSRCMKTWDELC